MQTVISATNNGICYKGCLKQGVHCLTSMHIFCRTSYGRPGIEAAKISTQIVLFREQKKMRWVIDILYVIKWRRMIFWWWRPRTLSRFTGWMTRAAVICVGINVHHALWPRFLTSHAVWWRGTVFSYLHCYICTPYCEGYPMSRSGAPDN